MCVDASWYTLLLACVPQFDTMHLNMSLVHCLTIGILDIYWENTGIQKHRNKGIDTMEDRRNAWE